MPNILLLTVLVALAWSLPSAAGEAAHHWSYEGAEGPSHWGGICQAGTSQSPIDIAAAKAARVKLPALAFDYRQGALHIVDNGHSIQVRVANGGTLSVGGARYALVQFHFHKPSEETIDGKHFAMVVHLVHQDAAGHLAVVAVPLGAGHENAVIASLWAAPAGRKGERGLAAGSDS